MNRTVKKRLLAGIFLALISVFIIGMCLAYNPEAAGMTNTQAESILER